MQDSFRGNLFRVRRFSLGKVIQELKEKEKFEAEMF